MIKRKPVPYGRVSAAWHEAGHTVIAQILGVRVQGTSIKPDLDNSAYGQTMYASLDLFHQWEDWRAGSTLKVSPLIGHAIIAMAGYAAQKLRPWHKGQRSTRHGYRNTRDHSQALQHLREAEKHCPETGDRSRRHARLLQATKTLVRRHKSAIARVAEALLRLEELDWLKIEALVPLRRWPADRPRPIAQLQHKQQRELIALLRRRVAALTTVTVSRLNGSTTTSVSS